MRKLLYAVVIVLIALFGLTFSYKNHQIIEIDYYFGIHFQGGLSLLLFITFALGLLVGCLAMLSGALSVGRKLSQAQRQLRAQQRAAS